MAPPEPAEFPEKLQPTTVAVLTSLYMPPPRPVKADAPAEFAVKVQPVTVTARQ